jgi:hypothetical protein
MREQFSFYVLQVLISVILCATNTACIRNPSNNQAWRAEWNAHAPVTYVVMSSYNMLESRVVPLRRWVYPQSEAYNSLVVIENLLPTQSNVLEADGCQNAATTYAGEVYLCPSYGPVLVASMCFDSSHAELAMSCKAEALMLAGDELSYSKWYVLIDDDGFVFTKALANFLDHRNHGEPWAFGFYGCGAQAGMPSCALGEPDHPHCYPVFAVISAGTLRAISRPLMDRFMSRTAVLVHLSHDTGLGIMLWSAGIRESDALTAPYSANANECFNMTTLERMPDMYCVIMHTKYVDAYTFFPAALNYSSEIEQRTIPEKDCLISQRTKDETILRECMGLDREEYRGALQNF